MKRILTCVAAALMGWHSADALAANYFVDAVIGNDSYTGTSAGVSGSSIGPWRTLTKVNAAVLQPGDAVFFRCGQSWRGTLRVVSSPSATSPIRYSRYGSDCNDTNKPTITTAAPVTGWQRWSGNIWVANTWFSVVQLFADGVALRLAQHPNTDYQAQAWARGMMTVDRTSLYPNQNRVIADLELSAIADRDLIGAGVHIRVNDFIINDRTVTAFDPVNMEITLNQVTDRVIYPRWGYYLDNKLWMLDAPGEFFFDGSDPANMKVYVYMPDGGSPESRVVGSTTSYGIEATGATNVVIEAMRAEKTGIGVAVGNSTNVTVRTTDVLDSYYRGMTANGARDALIDSCNVRRSGREGILAGSATHSRILNNRVTDSGVIGSPVATYGAISSAGTDMSIKGNYVLNSAYHGISFGKRSDIANNHVENACVILNDCGGIYTGNASGDSTPHNSTVYGNVISGIYGNLNGRDPVPVHAITPGIYLDYKTTGVYVAFNTVSEADMGMFVHSASSNTITDNTFYNYETYAVRIKEYEFAPITAANRFLRNKFLALKSGPPFMFVPAANKQTIAGLATFDMNRYSALYAEDPAILEMAKITYYYNGRYSDQFLNLPQWRQSGWDYSGTVFADFRIAPFAFQPVNGLNLVTNGTFDSNTTGWMPYATQGDSSLAWRSDCPLAGCAALTIGTSSPSGSLISPIFPVEAGKSYVIRFSNRSGGVPFTSLVVPRMAGPRTYEPFHDRFSVTVADTWSSRNVLFSVPANFVFQAGDRGARVDFAAPPGQVMFLDGIRVEEATSMPNNPQDDSFLLANPTNANASVSCPDRISAPERCFEYVYFDDGSPVTWPVTIAPRKSTIVLWSGNPFIR